MIIFILQRSQLGSRRSSELHQVTQPERGQSDVWIYVSHAARSLLWLSCFPDTGLMVSSKSHLSMLCLLLLFILLFGGSGGGVELVAKSKQCDYDKMLPNKPLGKQNEWRKTLSFARAAEARVTMLGCTPTSGEFILDWPNLSPHLQ